MRVTLLGTGCPVAHPRRGGAATLVEAEWRSDPFRLRLDGQLSGWSQAGCPGMDLDALIVTHLHSDHLVDFYQLVVSSWHQGRDRPWTVHCPETVVPGDRGHDGSLEGRARRCASPSSTGPRRPGSRSRHRVLGPRPSALQIRHPDGSRRSRCCTTRSHRPMALCFEAGGQESGDLGRHGRLRGADRGRPGGRSSWSTRSICTTTWLAKPGVSAARPRSATRRRTTRSRRKWAGSRRGWALKALALTHFVPPDFDRAVACWTEVAYKPMTAPSFVGEKT